VTLVCPRCSRSHEADERFCRECGMPLVREGAREVEAESAAHETARKIRPQFARGELVRVAGGRNQSEAELVQGILLNDGIPSVLRRTRGFDVPDFLAAGPRDVLVPESGYEEAARLLSEADLLTVEQSPNGLPGIGSPGRLALGVVLAFVLGGALVWVLYQLAS
jgi:pimeloyl-ACP methyl ester carboxylesterase